MTASLVKTSCVLALAGVLSGCAGMPQPSNVGCTVFKPIGWSQRDTRPTVRQVVAHNAVGREVCHWRPTR
jgi:hypothetical protein